MQRTAITVTALVALAVTAFGITPSVSAQEDTLESCSISPTAVTLGPGESATLTVTNNPPGGEATLISTFNGEIIAQDFLPAPSVSPITSEVDYDSLVALLTEVLGEPVSEGVFESSVNIVVGEGDDERFEALCTYTVTLVGAPEPTTTSTTAPEPVVPPATPRYTG